MTKSKKENMNTWLIIENYNNWLVDKENSFSFYGIAESRLINAKKMKAGDLLVNYISSPKKAFSGIRRVTSDNLIRLEYGGDYDQPFSLAVETTPVIILPDENWVKLQQVIGGLSFTKGRIRYGFAMRRTVRKLEPGDFRLIVAKMKRSYPDFDWASLESFGRN